MSKQILDQINYKISEILKINEWRGTASIINWFKEIKIKVQTNF